MFNSSCYTDAMCFVCPGVGWALAVTDVRPEVVALVSHATQECLRGLIVKLTLMAEHRKAALKVHQSDLDQKGCHRRPVAQLVEWASHVQRLYPCCSGPGLES